MTTKLWGMKSIAKEKNRFAGFERLSGNFASNQANDAEKVGKSKDSNYEKGTLYLTKELHFKLRSQALATAEDMSELVERVMTNYFNQ